MIEPLSVARRNIPATYSDTYAWFPGGISNNTASSAVDVYDVDLTHTALTISSSFPSPEIGMSSAFNGRVFILNGDQGSGDGSLYIYADDLSCSVGSAKYAYKDPASATGTNFAVIGGGSNNSRTAQAHVLLIKSAYNYVTNITLTTARDLCAAAIVGTNALFAGGYGTNTMLKSVEKITNTGTKGTVADLTQKLCLLGGSSIENYAIFAGGLGNEFSGDVSAYNTNLTKTIADSLCVNRQNLAASNWNYQYAVFAGGGKGGDSDDIEVYDNDLVHTVLKPLPTIDEYTSVSRIGDYILIAGGSRIKDQVFVYKVNAS